MTENGKEFTGKVLDTMLKSAIEEDSRAKARRETLERVEEQLSELLRENDVTWGEFQNIIEKFSATTFRVVNSMKMSKIQTLSNQPPVL